MTDEQKNYMYGNFATDVAELERSCSKTDCASEMSDIPSGLVTIDESRYEELLAAEEMLDALRSAGVDNWEGIDLALEIFETF